MDVSFEMEGLVGHPTGLNQPRRSDFLAPWFSGKWGLPKSKSFANKQAARASGGREYPLVIFSSDIYIYTYIYIFPNWFE